ncbi:MAG TPA: hydroxysqualene dehydroxylase HpnE [Stellaceae bacterium]|nr:hydroxysqualene dehydroxylase HpnE [Stellaceae bacterium]
MDRIKRVHVVGAGLAGLAASLQLVKAGVDVALHEAAPQAGGRCRSYFDETLGCRIDNGNHLVIAGNTAVMTYLGGIDALGTVGGPPDARFDFLDLTSGERWVVRPNPSRVPWWIFCADRRVPGTTAWDYLRGLRLAWARRDDTVTALLNRETALFKRLWEPLAVSALNTDLEEASAASLARVLRETFGKGGAACRPLAPIEGLSESLVEPALKRLRATGSQIRLGSRLRGIEFQDQRASKLVFDQGDEPLNAGEAAVIAVPPTVATRVVPGLTAPDAFRPIVNAHFRVTAPDDTPLFIGVIGGATQWVFRKPGVLSVTISAANGLVDAPAQELAQLIWPEVQRAYDLPVGPLPPWQIVKEKRATFAATPAQLSRRPKTDTNWENLVLAGDWTDTGLPATIEGAIRSGFAAASHLLGGGRTSLMNAHSA